MHPNNRIIHGENVPISSRPFQLYLKIRENGKEFICGASLIALNWALTAGHCVTDKNGNVVNQQIEIRAGSNNIEYGYQSRMASPTDVKVHPLWTGNFEDGWGVGTLYPFYKSLETQALWYRNMMFPMSQ